MSVEKEILTNICFFIGQQAHAIQQPDTAEFWYKEALKLDKDNTEIHYALSYITAMQRRFPEAIEHSTFAIKGKHDAIAQYNRALMKLMIGDYKGGFEDYEARLKFKLNEDSRLRRFGNLPYWKGEPCKVLHVSGEQGFGDIFQFCRFMPLIKDKFKVEKIYFEVPKSLHNFFKYNYRNSPEIEVVSEYWHPKADYHVQLVSLCNIFGVTLDTIPQIKLEAEPEKIEKFNKFYGRISKLKVGICYSGRANAEDMQVKEWNSRRDLPKEEIEKIIGPTNPHITKIMLQPELNSAIEDWSDTAGIMANMDLIVSADSGPVHLAAALGKPTWLLNHYHTCWRYMLEGEHTPWYNDNLYIFRQKTEGDWGPVLKEFASKLEETAKCR